MITKLQTTAESLQISDMFLYQDKWKRVVNIRRAVEKEFLGQVIIQTPNQVLMLPADFPVEVERDVPIIKSLPKMKKQKKEA